MKTYQIRLDLDISTIRAILKEFNKLSLTIEEMRKCKKMKLTDFASKYILSFAEQSRQKDKNSQRKEVRRYFCIECKAYHTTSKP